MILECSFQPQLACCPCAPLPETPWPRRISKHGQLHRFNLQNTRCTHLHCAGRVAHLDETQRSNVGICRLGPVAQVKEVIRGPNNEFPLKHKG